jgi:hypothetical protein
LFQYIQRGEKVRNELVKVTQKWAAGDTDLKLLRELRSEAILLNHAHYLDTIPVYQRLAREEGIGKDTDIETIKKKLTFTDGIFKSYEQEWLDSGDFSSMNRWLSSIYDKRIEFNVSGIASIEKWAERLGANGIKLVYSSGTSGTFSFVPRDEKDWIVARDVNIACLAPFLVSRLTSASAQLLMKIMSPDVMVKSVMKIGLPDYDGIFLGFRQGRMGNQVLIRELALLFRRCSFLYDMDITATALRALTTGAHNKQESELLDNLRTQITGPGKEENYTRIIKSIRESTDIGHKVFIFGAPYQFKELCEMMVDIRPGLALKKGSLVLFGGGWKSFSGETVEREQLVGMISRSFGLPTEMVMEGYSMTEINMLMLRCSHGRFHIPPLIEPVVCDEELNPVEGGDISGRFGFLDPLAFSHPGFIISGDAVHMVDSECECGLSGPAITEISRALGQEVKGCGGIMGAMKA